MKRFVLLLILFLSLSDVFASSTQISEEKCRRVASNSIYLITINDSDTVNIMNKVTKFFNAIPLFNRIFKEVYNEKKKEFNDQTDPDLEAKERFLQIGNKLGLN